MSGAAVAVPVIPVIVIAAMPVVLAGLGVGLILYGAAKGIKAIVDAKAEQARVRAVVEKARMAEWQAFHAQQEETMAKVRLTGEAMRDLQAALLKVRLRAVEAPSLTHTPRIQRRDAQRQVAMDERAMAQKLMNGISGLLEALPRDLHDQQYAPFAPLEEQVAKWRQSKTPPNLSSIEKFRQTVENTVANYARKLSDEREGQKEMGQRLEQLLDRVLLLSELRSPWVGELLALRVAMKSGLSSPGPLKVGWLNSLETRLATIETKVLEDLALFATRNALAEATLRHFRRMDYEIIEGFPTEFEDAQVKAIVRVPGGGQVRVTMQPNAKLTFRLLHERDGDAGQLSDEEFAGYRLTEKRFCANLLAVGESLREEGFNVQLQAVPDTSRAQIEVVKVVFFGDEKKPEVAREDESLRERQHRDAARKNRRLK